MDNSTINWLTRVLNYPYKLLLTELTSRLKCQVSSYKVHKVEGASGKVHLNVLTPFRNPSTSYCFFLSFIQNFLGFLFGSGLYTIYGIPSDDAEALLPSNGRPKGSSIIDVQCSCGRKLCDPCVLDIFRDKTKMERISRLWPQSPLNVMADHHYFYSKDCDVVKKYIERYGPPSLSSCIPTVRSVYNAASI